MSHNIKLTLGNFTMKPFLLLFILSFSILGCNDKVNLNSTTAYFGGEIVNPKNNYVIMGRADAEEDTIQLDSENRFLKKIENLNPGIYTFKHGDEYQIVLLEPNDSIMFRLNTIDFDDSLVFTGDGSKKNNYLIKIFLENEVDSKNLMSNFEYDPEEFVEFLESNRATRLNELKEFLNFKPQSSLFEKIALASINYHYYSIKEIYPFGYFGNNNLIHFNDLPDNFYSFRKNIDYNQEDLRDVFAYNRFLFRHFNNLALNNFYDTNDHNVSFDRESLTFNLSKLDLMDSLVNNNAIKNYLLKYTTRDFIYNSNNETDINLVFDSFKSKCNDEESKASVIELINSIKRTNAGVEFPNIEVVNYDDTVFNLKSIINKPTVIYFWSSTYKMHNRNVHYQITKLRKEFPKINFYGVNVGTDSEAYWKQTISQIKSPPHTEFRFNNASDAIEMLAINSVNKVFIVNGKKKIVSSNLNMFNEDFKAELKKL